MGGRGAARAPVAFSRFAVLPPLAFGFREQIESLSHGGRLLGVVVEPTFIPGLALQLPFALLAYLMARAVRGPAARVGAWPSGGREASTAVGVARRARSSILLAAPRPAPRRGVHSGRGPPAMRPFMCACD